MAKFKIGDRVRATKTLVDITAGNGYTVVEVDHQDDAMPVRVIDDNGDRCWLYSDQFTLITLTIEPGRHYRTRSGKPTGRVTVGDTGFEAVVDGRVRIFDKAGGAVHGDDDIVEEWTPRVGERVRYKNREFGEATVLEVDGENHIKVDTHGPYKICTERLHSLEPLPVAPQPAAQEPALKIEAGRYYKTRDGRKVGPIRDKDDLNDHYPFRADGGPGGTIYYKADGYSCPGAANRHRDQDDLIAEWQETTNVGAQIDTLAEEYGPARVATTSDDNAAKPKFKVGDRVVVTCNKTNGGTPIREYVIGGVYPITSIVKDLNGNDAVQLNSHYQYLKQGQFQLTTTAIVALIENGLPKPAAIPHVHASQAAAEREAKRLAGVHKGKQFGVYVLVTTAEEPAPIYAHEWQRLAVKGRKIDAIKEIRGLTGMGLKPAKDAVEYFLAYPYGQAA